LRLFQLYLVKQGTSSITLNATLTGLRFFFCQTLNRPEVVGKLSTVSSR
jgi:integrase/recombinase XerD